MKLTSTLLLGIAAFGVTFGVMRFLKKKDVDVAQVVPTRAVAQAPASPIEFSTSELRSNNGNYSLNLGFTVKKGCFLGELDAMDMDVAHGDSENFILSLETLDAGAGQGQVTPQIIKLNRSHLSVGLVDGEMKNLRAKAPANFAVYLCRDSSARNQCGNKPFLRADDLVVANSQDSKQPNFKAPDRIYFAQYLYWDGAGKVHYFKQTPRSVDFAVPVRATSAESGVWDNFAKVSSRLSALIPTLQSYPFRGVDGKLAFQLARYDRALCK